jgi:hypothetical protein
MGYVPPPAPGWGQTVVGGWGDEPPLPRLNVDRFGMPRDYATYKWLLYRKRIDDRSPERMAFLHHKED